MPATVGSIFSTKANVIREVINNSVEELIPTGDPVFEDLMIGKGTVSDQGRDLLVHRHFRKGMAGVIMGGGANRDMVLYGDSNNTNLGAKLFTQDVTRTYPDPTLGTKQQSFRLSIPMRGFETNLMLTKGELQLEATKANIDEIVTPTLTGFARNMMQYVTNYFYLSQDNFYQLCNMPASSRTLADSNRSLTVDIKLSTYATNRFMEGMLVQVYDSTGATLRTHSDFGGLPYLVVTQVDEIAGTVTFRHVRNAAMTNIGLADNDIIVYANSKGDASTPYASGAFFTGIAGYNSWLKFGTGGNDNILLGAEATNEAGFTGRIDVTVHPEFKSLSFNRNGAPLSEHYLRQVFSAWERSKSRYGQTVDTLLMPDGVLLAYESQMTTRAVIDRTQMLSTLNKGQGTEPGFNFSWNGKTYKGRVSQYMPAGTVLGLKLQNNWEQYSPANAKGGKKLSQVDSFIPFEFVAGIVSGTSNHMLPIMRTAAAPGNALLTEGAQMPGEFKMQLVPKQPAGFRITNVQEERIYA